MLPTLRKFPDCAWKPYPRGARPALFAALATAALFAAPIGATAQRNKIVIGLPNQKTKPRVAAPNNNAAVLTYHNNNQRTGLNSSETAFIPLGANANLNASNFGKIWTRAVDGTIYTQPLFVPAVQFPNAPDLLNSSTKNGVYNAVFVCTTHNSIYAFDAGNSVPITHPTSTSTAVRSVPIWHINFNLPNAGIGPVPIDDVFSEDLKPEIGITGTPVVDMQTDAVTGFKKGTLYVVVKTKEGNAYAQRLHAIDITTGKDVVPATLIQARVLGTGDGSILDPGNGNKPTVFFDPQWENQEAALTLSNGQVYVAWGSHGDNGPYHGWVMAFNASTLQPTGVLNTSPNGDSSSLSFPAGAGIWGGGAGPAVDENGNLFVATGTGQFDADAGLLSGGTEFGNSVLKLQFPSGASGPVVDFFTPNNWQPLSANLLDVGSGGVMVLPPVGNLVASRLAVAAGTEGTIYLLNRDTGSLGQFTIGSDNVVQSLPGAVGPIFGLPAFFNNTLYYQGTGDVMKAFQFQFGVLNDVPVSQSTNKFGFPGSSPTVTSSADGTNGIVWSLERYTPPPILPTFLFPEIPEPTPYSVLHAYNPANLSNEFYSSLTMGSRDLSSSALYTPPTVVNGRAYVGGVNELAAYGYFADNGVTAGPNAADHYVITGPDTVAQKAGNWYSITAIGPDGSPIKLSGTVHLSYRTFGGPTTSIMALNFNGQSNLLFQYAFMNSFVYEFYANDDFGHSSYVPDMDLMPFGTLFPEIFVNLQDTSGPDHLIVKAPTQAKVGSKITVQVTTVTPTNVPYTWQPNAANFFAPNLQATMTLPDGTQGAVPFAPGYAYSNGTTVPVKIGTSVSTIQFTVPSVGNHVLIVTGYVSYFYGTDPTNPTTVISYPLTGTAAVVGVP